MTNTSASFAGAIKVDSFQPDQLPAGKISRLMVRLTSDALGQPLSIPMMVAKGTRPGPVFGLCAAVHGNEVNGIPVIHRLFKAIDTNQLKGAIAALPVVNVPGLINNERAFSDGTDLNHVMPGSATGNDGELYAARFVDRILRKFELLVDLHTASFGRVNSLYVRADMSKPMTARMALLQRPQIILHNPPSDTTVRGAAEELNIAAVTVEVGDPQRFQPELIRRTLAGIRAVLIEKKMIPRRKLVVAPPPVICSQSEWLYTDHGGLLEVLPKLTQFVEQGEVVARLCNIFGDLLREYRAPASGVVIGKSTNPVGQAGARILHLGTVVDSIEQLQSVH